VHVLDGACLEQGVLGRVGSTCQVFPATLQNGKLTRKKQDKQDISSCAG
jgi:hypothetical protein